MENNIRYYVDEIFSETTPSRKSVELKEEMIQNLQDKYNDLLSEGKTPEAAYNIVVAGIGDVSALLGELENDRTPQGIQREEIRRKSAMFTAVAVSMYILSVLPVILLRNLTGVVILIVMAAIATGILVFINLAHPDPDDDEDSMVEEFRAWRAGTHEQRSMMRAVSSAMWSVVVALYFIISFTTGAWHITWVIFLIAAAAQSLIKVFWPIGR